MILIRRATLRLRGVLIDTPKGTRIAVRIKSLCYRRDLYVRIWVIHNNPIEKQVWDQHCC